MNESVLVIIIAYVMFSALLLAALIKSQINWIVKTLCLVIAIGFYITSYYGWKDAQGWPSRTEPPKRFFLHFAMVEEPDKELNIKGKILLWASKIENRELSETPRVYQLKYSRSLHSEVERAMHRTKEGKQQIGIMERNKARMQTESSGSLARDDQFSFYFYDLEESALPEK